MVGLITVHPEEHVILVVDDNLASRYVTSRILKNEGFSIIEAETGEQAIREAQKIPDLIVLDVHLPDITGFEVCDRLKKDPVTTNIPILHLSASYMDTRSIVTGYNTGAEGYLTQPVEAPVLIASVTSLIRNRIIERELMKQKNLLDTFVNSAPMPIYLFDLKGNYLLVNDALCTLFQMKKSDIIGKNRSEFLSPDDTRVNQSHNEEVIRQKKPIKFVEKAVLQDGMHVFDSVKFPVFDQAGDVIAIGGISIDITERIRKEELIQEQEMMLNLAHIFITDLQGIIIYWNEGSEKMYGYTREEAVGSDVCELLHCSGTTDFSEMRDMVLSSGSSKVEIRQQKKDGTQVDITSIWTVYSTKEGEPKAIIWTNYDQTASVALQRIREEALSRIEKNMLQLMTLNDQIRNPLSIMVAALDLDVPDKDTIITEQIQVIDDIINRLDNGYLESSKVHEFLRRYESIR